MDLASRNFAMGVSRTVTRYALSLDTSDCCDGWMPSQFRHDAASAATAHPHERSELGGAQEARRNFGKGLGTECDYALTTCARIRYNARV